MTRVQEVARAAVLRFGGALDGLGPFEARPHLALAVSGGPDSTALMLAAKVWADRSGGRLTALTVDHRIRPDSRQEAEAVGKAAHALGLDHVILTVTEDLAGGDLEAAARTARYGLLAGWCRLAGVLHLLTGHTADDQAETLLMRLLRGSGLDGLAAMEPVHPVGGVRLLRPALGMARDELHSIVFVAGERFYLDPMNRDMRFQRVAVREAMARLNLTASRLADTAGRLRRDRQVIEDMVEALLVEAVRLSAWGEGTILRRALAGAPAPVVERALGRLIVAIGAGNYPPRRDHLARLADLLANPDGKFPGATLGGCRFLAGGATVAVVREARRLGPDLHLAPGEDGRWDGRFDIVAGPRPVRIAPLGECQAKGLDRPAPARRAVLPAVFSENELVAVPALDFGDPAAAHMRYRPGRAISA